MAGTKKILIADASERTRNAMRMFAAQHPEAEIAAVAHSGTEAIRILDSQPIDFMVLDLVLTQEDGTTVLDHLASSSSPRPRVLVLSAMASDDIVTRAMRSGASYFLLKPFDNAVLFQKIEEILNGNLNSSNFFASGIYALPRNLDEKISVLFLTIGLPVHMLGYSYLWEAVKLAMDDPKMIHAITRKLYPRLAEIFSTSASQVERAIRSTLEFAWIRGDVERVNRYFGCPVISKRIRPSNSEFIALIAEKLRVDRTVERDLAMK